MAEYKSCANCGVDLEFHEGGGREMWVHRKGTGTGIRFYLNCADDTYGLNPKFEGPVADPEFRQERLV